MHKPQIQSEEEELQELWDRDSEPVQGDSSPVFLPAFASVSERLLGLVFPEVDVWQTDCQRKRFFSLSNLTFAAMLSWMALRRQAGGGGGGEPGESHWQMKAR